MSLRAMIWALEDAPVDDPTSLLVLIALADKASDDGTAAYPSRATIASRARISSRTVQRHLNSLEDAGVIERGDQSILARRGFPVNRRPTVWNIRMDRRRGDNDDTLG